MRKEVPSAPATQRIKFHISCGLPLSLVQLCRPVQNDRHGRGPCLFDLRKDQEALSILADIINELIAARAGLSRSSLEQCDGLARIEIGFGGYCSCHHSVISRKEEQLFTVCPPSWLFPSTGRNLPFAASPGKRGDVDLPLAGLIRGVSHPFPVGRELSTRHDGRRFQKQTALELRVGEDPQFRGSRVQDVLGVPGPVVRKLVRVGMKDELFFMSSVEVLQVKIVPACLIGKVNQPLRVWTPNRTSEKRGAEGEPFSRIALQVISPNVRPQAQAVTPRYPANRHRAACICWDDSGWKSSWLRARSAACGWDHSKALAAKS